MNTYKTSRTLLLILIVLSLVTAFQVGAQTTQSVEQLKKQVEDLKEKGKASDTWSPAMKSVYEQSLKALITAYDQAIENEIKQVEDLMKVIAPEQAAAKTPLEKRLGELKALKSPATTPKPTPTPSPSPTPVSTPTPTPQPALFTLSVYAKVKGSGYPVSGAHVELLKLAPNSNPPEYQLMESDFKCDDPRNKCITSPDKPLKIFITVTDPAPTLKVAVIDDPYHPVLQSEVIVPSPGGKKTINLEMIPKDDDYYRAILGVEQAGLSSNGNQQNIFFNLFTSRPLLKSAHYYTEPGREICRELDDPSKRYSTQQKTNHSCYPPRQRIWGEFRVTSVPQPRQNLFQALSGSLGGSLNDGIGKIGDLETGVAFRAGYQVKLTRGYIAGNRFDFSLLVGGGGAAVPAPNKGVTIFAKPDAADTQRLKSLRDSILAQSGYDIDKPELKPYKNFAFVVKERDRFFRSYFGGLRFETFYGNTTPVSPSAMFDLTVGQDETITGGRMRGAVLSLDGFFPLPIGHGNLVYLFGTAQMALTRAKLEDPLLLPLADTTQTLTSKDTLIVPVQAPNRDLYRFGVGVNLLQVFTGTPKK
ncbi:MAG TPA: hypothetical protein PLK30_13795 [Blastocatellia bacterium]|nr:hypothetical protein [Blastocatellia bacterium]